MATYMYEDWIIERTEYYAKVDPKCVLRDALPTDNPGDRIELSMSTVVELLKYIFRDFLTDPVKICEKKERINAARKAFYEVHGAENVKEMMISGTSTKAKKQCVAARGRMQRWPHGGAKER